MSLAISTRIGLPLPATFSRAAHCVTSGHNGILDNMTSHFESCPTGGQVTRRHNHLVRVLNQMFKAKGHPTEIEPSGLFPGGEERPDLYSINAGTVDKQKPLTDPLIVDVMVTSVTSPTNLANGASDRNGSSAKAGEEFKRNKWRDPLSRLPSRAEFLPAVIETPGRFGKAVLNFAELAVLPLLSLSGAVVAL